ncbi:Hemolymph clottable protein [Armadillidium nasatum]|uniref:Hemolymph clottable protein n=1 Tax=Armadillidium nasatum TaxID=96803 RepID=A0A5N5T930_9CRUS|nr:Hemolymph clottable protein [Armadillidium nasatum]
MKMKFVVLFFALVGATYALVPGMEYEYDYEGQVKIGFPEIRNRVAGAGIKCTINVQVQNEHDVAIKLKDVEVGEYKGDLDCELRQRMKIDYKPISGHGKLLEDVYMIHPSRTEGEVMESTKSEEVWITNIKKSIAGLFIVEPIRNNFGGDDSALNMLNVRSNGHSTVDEEPSLFGRCSGEYSMVPLNNTDKHAKFSKRGSAYPEQWTNYEMSRTVNLDKCNVTVNTKQTSFGNTSQSHVTQFGDVQSRHSLMKHNLTYDGQYFIIQNGTNEGHFTLNPYGMNHEKLVSISNQTYHLKSVKNMNSLWDLPTSTRIIDIWYMEAVSPFSPGEDAVEWVRYERRPDARYDPLVEEQYWTGIDITAHYDEHKKNLDKSIDAVAEIAQKEEKPPTEHDINPFDSDSAVMASYLEIALRAARSLDQDRLKQLFDQYYKDSSMKSQIKLRILIDVLGATGTGAPIKAFLDKIAEKKIDIHRTASVFFAMPNNLISTPMIQEIGEYVRKLDLDKDDPFATGVIWMNFAATLNKVCINRLRYKHTVPYQILGKEHCTDKEAVDVLLPFLEQQLKKADEEWKQIILVHAIGNIGASRGFSVLKSIVEDERLNTTVRVAAVYSISKNKLDPSFYRFALRTFMSVAENRTDDEFVRQACILAILSWKPPRSWYQTLASNSWYENSDEMSSFTYFILKSYAESTDPEIAEQAQVARFFLPLTKPYAPTSRYSYSRLLSIYDTKHDSSLSYDARDIHSLLQKMSRLVTEGWRNVRSSPNRKTQLAIQDVQTRMIMKQSNPSSALATFYFSVFDDMELLLPLNKDTVSKAFGLNAAKLLKQIDYTSANYTKFVNPGLVSLVLPTELGLPLISRFSMPTYTGGPLKDLSLTADGKKCKNLSQLVRAKEIKLDFNSNYRFASKAITMIRVLMPWEEKVAVSAVEALKAISLPARYSFTVNKEDPKHYNISGGIVPTSNDKFTVAQLHTMPFIVTKKMFALEQPNLIPSLFSSPTCRMLETSVVIDMSQSKTKEIHSSTALRIDSPTDMKLTGDLPVFEYKSTLLFNGSETRYFETQIKNSEVSQSGSRHTTKLQVNYKRSQLPHFDSNPAGYCVSLTRDSPVIKSVDDLRNVLQSSQNAQVNVKGDLTGGSGAKACDEKHIASITGSLKLSDERRVNLSQELNSVCSYDANDPTVTFVTAPVYDRVNVDISYQEPVPRPLKNATYLLYDVVRGFSFPHVYFNYMDQQTNPQGKISIRGDRYLSEKRWKLDVKLPTESSKYDNFKMPRFVEDIMPVGGIEPSPQRFDAPKLFVDSHVDNRCNIGKDKVRTFDGHSFDYNADKCLAVAIRDRRTARSPVLYTGLEQDILIGALHFLTSGTAVVIKHNTLTVDNRELRLGKEPTEIKSSDGTVLARALKTDSFVQIDVPEFARIRVKSSQEISIVPSESMRAHFGGLCGNYDSNKQDLIGPQLCKYSDSQLFAKSWTENVGKECTPDHYNQLHHDVEVYQKDCPRASHNLVQKASILADYGKVPADCIEYVYLIKRNGQALCVSQDIVAICYPLCKLDKPRYYNEVYDCWPEQYAPKELERNEKRGYIRHKIDRQAYVTSGFKTEHAFMCSRK